MTLNQSIYSSEKMDWETPDTLFEDLNAEFFFDTDVAASENNKKCENYFDEKTDGLTKKWSGVCWMNPPYGREIEKWVSKAREETLGGDADKVVCLVPVRSDTKWWHKNIMKSKEIRFLDKRLSFKGSTNKAPFTACIVIFDKFNTEPVKVGVQKVR